MPFNILKRFNFYFVRNSSAIVGIQIYLTTVNDYSQQLFFVSKLVTDYIENQVELKYVSYETDKIQNNGNDIKIKNKEMDTKKQISMQNRIKVYFYVIIQVVFTFDIYHQTK